MSDSMQRIKDVVSNPNISPQSIIDYLIQEIQQMQGDTGKVNASDQALLDIHNALGVKMGDDPYAKISALTKNAELLNQVAAHFGQDDQTSLAVDALPGLVAKLKAEKDYLVSIVPSSTTETKEAGQ